MEAEKEQLVRLEKNQDSEVFWKLSGGSECIKEESVINYIPRRWYIKEAEG